MRRWPYNFLDSLKDEELPTLIILDYHMPMINGIEMLNRLKQASRFDKIPKVMYSAVLNSKDVVKCKDAGATECYEKSGSIEIIRSQVAHMLTHCI